MSNHTTTGQPAESADAPSSADDHLRSSDDRPLPRVHPNAVLPPPMSAQEPVDPTEALAEAWSSLLDNVSKANRPWLRNATPVTMHSSTAMVAVPNEFARDHIETKMRAELEELLSDSFHRPIHLAITIDPDLELALGAPDRPEDDEEELPVAEFVPRAGVSPAPVLPSDAGSGAEQSDDPAAHLNPKYTFDSFVIGSSNRFAHAAAVAVAESPGKSYNPLLIYGGSGLARRICCTPSAPTCSATTTTCE